jgi:hypothetical protein
VFALLLACASPFERPQFSPPASAGDVQLHHASDRVGLCDIPPWMAYPVHQQDGFGFHEDELRTLSGASDFARYHTPTLSPFAYDLIVTPEGYDWSIADHAVATTQRYGLGQLATIRPRSAEWGEQPAAHLPPDEDAYAAFVQAMVERYDGDGIDDMPGLEIAVRHWEIDNEPSQTSTQAYRYVNLVAASAQAIRAADPDAVVLNGGAAPLRGPASELQNIVRIGTFWNQAVDEGLLEHIDAFSVHAAPNWVDADPALLEDAWRARLGEEIPLWLTEGGPTDVNGNAVAPDAAGQALWLADWMDAALPRYERVMVCDVFTMAQSPEWLDVIADANESAAR